MEVLYSTVKFKKRERRQTGDGEPSKTVAEKEDVTYSTLKFSTQAGQSRPDDSVDPSAEPVSEVPTTGQAKERLLWISLCALFFAVALVTGILYIHGSISHKENTKVKHELIKQLQTSNTNLTSDVKDKDKLIKHLQAEKSNLTEEKEKIIQQLQTEKNKQTCHPQSSIASDACCARGWKYFSGKCYYFSTDEKTWTESRDACVAAGGDLVIINSTEEQNFLKRSYPGGSEQLYWVGLTDAVKEGDWRWLDGTRLSETPTIWNGKEPDNWTGNNKQYPEGEDCALMLLSTNYYRLQDAFCAVEKKEKRVCETKVLKRIKQKKGQ